jgi:mannosyltransferase OCH1-like enzyme
LRPDDVYSTLAVTSASTQSLPPGKWSKGRNLAERADLVRYEVLRRHGGVYVDTDVECLRPIDDLLDGVVAFAAYEVPGRLCNAVLGAVPAHPAFARAVDLAATTVGRGTYPDATATSFLTYILEAHEDVTLFGAERFYPVLWDGSANAAPADDPPHAFHHWAKSWIDTKSQHIPLGLSGAGFEGGLAPGRLP